VPGSLGEQGRISVDFEISNIVVEESDEKREGE
jgi:hypothetical protein